MGTLFIVIELRMISDKVEGWSKKRENVLYGWPPVICLFSKFALKPSQNKKDQHFLAAPKRVSFSHLPAVKKDTIFGAASYFVTTLCLVLLQVPKCFVPVQIF